MYLSVLQLENNETISTGLRINKTMTIRAIRLGLYKHNTPDGTLTITLKDGATTIGTESVTMASLDATVGTYFHGFMLYDLETPIRVNVDPTTSYKELSLEISLTSHTDDPSNYIALQKTIEGAYITPHGTITNESDMTVEQLTHFAPYMLEIYTL